MTQTLPGIGTLERGERSERVESAPRHERPAADARAAASPQAVGTERFLVVDNVCKRYEGTARGTALALDGVGFEVRKGAFVTLLGPSGCGKSTLLNLVAGLDSPSSGRIDIAGRTVYDSSRRVELAPGERHISMVFQSYAIWPHMTVRENVEFPLRHGSWSRAMSAADRRAAVDHALEKVRLSAFAERPAPLLSGGQQQRVSLARALAQKPSIILLDEPLSNLDAGLREHMQREIRAIVSGEGITALYVTHDQKEALSMSDMVVLLKDGRVQQIGSPEAVYYRPTNRFVAEFMGWPNLIAAEVEAAGDGLLRCASSLGTVVVRQRDDLAPARAGDRIDIVLKQEDLRLVQEGDPAPATNAFSLPVLRQTFHGDRLEVICGNGERTLSIYANARRRPQGPTVSFTCRPEEIHYFPHESCASGPTP